jgi:hypothetical protein
MWQAVGTAFSPALWGSAKAQQLRHLKAYSMIAINLMS